MGFQTALKLLKNVEKMKGHERSVKKTNSSYK